MSFLGFKPFRPCGGVSSDILNYFEKFTVNNDNIGKQLSNIISELNKENKTGNVNVTDNQQNPITVKDVNIDKLITCINSKFKTTLTYDEFYKIKVPNTTIGGAKNKVQIGKKLHTMYVKMNGEFVTVAKAQKMAKKK